MQGNKLHVRLACHARTTSLPRHRPRLRSLTFRERLLDISAFIEGSCPNPIYCTTEELSRSEDKTQQEGNLNCILSTAMGYSSSLSFGIPNNQYHYYSDQNHCSKPGRLLSFMS